MDENKIHLKYLAIIVLALSAFLAIFFLTFFERQAYPIDNSAFVIKSDKELPIRIRIPKINVEASIEQVGLTNKGAMEAPQGPETAGWYNLGVRPGEEGNSVIDGHSGWKGGLPAVFDDLSDLRKGDRIYVDEENGATYAFVVREVRVYDPKDDATAVFFSSDGKAHLNLITCEGIWDKASGSNTERLVVFADME